MSILILNFSECPENYHFETVISQILSKLNISFSVIHSFKHDYSALSDGRIHNRVHVSKISLENLLKTPFILLISIDFPWKRDKSYLAYLRIIKNIKSKKIIIANHLCPDPGQSAFIDDLRKTVISNLFKTIYIFEYDDKRIWPFPPSIIKMRKFGIDTDYYKPLNSEKKYDILCFGSKSRNFNILQRLSQTFHIAALTNSKIEIQGLTTINLNENIFKIREIINSTKLVVAPVNDNEINPACGNTALFLAMACGVGAVVRETDYMKKYVRDQINSFLYKTEEEFYKKIILALNNPQKLKQISQNARKTAEKHASLKKIIKCILEKEVR